MRFQTLPILSSVLLISALLLPFSGNAAENRAATQKIAPRAAQRPEALSGDELIADSWYTVTVNGKIPYGYYNDRIELKKGRLFFQNHYFKKEEDFINEEQLGAFAEGNPELKPLFYNYHSTFRSTETTIDGTVVDGKILSVKIKKAGQELPPIKKTIAPGTIFEVFFPVWLGYQASKMKPGQTSSFKAIFEDSIDTGFSAETGRVKMEKPDDFATRSGTLKFLVDSRGVKSFWWIDAKGIPAKIEMPQQKILVQRVEKEQATAFLGGK